MSDSETMTRVREAVTEHHRRHGTTRPEAHRIEKSREDVHGIWILCPVPGRERSERRLLMLGKDLADSVGRMIDNVETRWSWGDAFDRMSDGLQGAFEAIARGTGATLNEATRIDWKGDAELLTCTYHLQVGTMNDAFQRCRAIWRIEATATRDDVIAWRMPDESGPRKQARLARRRDTERGELLDVSATTARWARNQPDRNMTTRMLFAASRGAKGSKVPQHDVTLLQAHEGRVVSTHHLGGGVSVRGDVVTARGLNLPATSLAAMRGRSMDQVIEHRLLEGRRIRSARAVGDKLTITLETEDQDLADLMRELDERT